MDYDAIIADLKDAYDGAADERDQKETAQWKIELRNKFFKLLESENKSALLEIGAGTGKDSRYFHEQGLRVTCIDLSPENVHRCRQKGLNALEMDFNKMNFPPSTFEAVYAMNCLLHVPHQNFGKILDSVYDLLHPSGLFFLGQFGGKDFEGIYDEDQYQPKRFYSFWTDAQIKGLAEDKFTIENFETREHDPEEEIHFQCLFLRRD